jgi:hypothetical protein
MTVSASSCGTRISNFKVPGYRDRDIDQVRFAGLGICSDVRLRHAVFLASLAGVPESVRPAEERCTELQQKRF